MKKNLSAKILNSLVGVMLVCTSLFFQKAVLAEDGAEDIGDKLQWIILASGLGGTVFYEQGNEGTIQFLQSFLSSQLITEALKLSVDKTRPNGNCCKSFPSGHASKAFMGAGFIHKRYGFSISVPAYVAATYVGYSRVHTDKHYVEDVVAGAAIGMLSSYYFTTEYKGVEISPVVAEGVYGINLSRRW